MSKEDYYEKFKDPRWQKKRLEIFERDEFFCRRCQNNEKTLNVHHLYYDMQYKNPWDYPEDALITLCEDCHKHEKENMSFQSKRLINNLKKCGFLSDEIERIAQGFDKYYCRYAPEPDADILHFILTYEPVREIAENIFFSTRNKDGK